VANTYLTPDGNESIGQYHLPYDPDVTYELDFPTNHPNDQLIVDIYIYDGYDKDEGEGINHMRGPVPGYIDKDGNIIPFPDPVVPLPPGTNYYLVVYATDDDGDTRELGFSHFIRLPGIIDIEDGVTADDEKVVIGEYTPPDGFEDRYDELIVTIVIKDEDGVEHEITGTVDKDGNIIVDGKDLPIGDDMDITITITLPGEGPNGDDVIMAGPTEDVITVFPSNPSGLVYITYIDLFRVDEVEWVEIHTTGCRNWTRFYTIFGAPEMRDITGFFDPSWEEMDVMRQQPERSNKAGNLEFFFPKPDDYRFYFHGRELRP